MTRYLITKRANVCQVEVEIEDQDQDSEEDAMLLAAQRLYWDSHINDRDVQYTVKKLQ